MKRRALAFAVAFLAAPHAILAQSIERNVVYGMYSGLGLLMDVYRPAQSNGIAIVAIQGSGWYSPMRYDAAALNSNPQVVRHAERFAAAGYTVFVINHRQAPRFRYPAPIEDAQRAVRFIRFHAARFGVTSEKIGAWGSSSGGHLVELLGTIDGKGDASDSDPVNRLDAKVQTVVALFAPADLPLMFTTGRTTALVSLMGFAYQDPEAGPPGVRVARPDDFENRQYREASPITHVSADDGPMLLMHGDRDAVVPLKQSELMEAALKQARVPVTLIKVSGGNHGPNFQLPAGDPRLPDHMGEAVRWFDRHLKANRTP